MKTYRVHKSGMPIDANHVPLTPGKDYTEAELKERGCPIDDWLNSGHLLEQADVAEMNADGTVPGVIQGPTSGILEGPDEAVEIKTGARNARGVSSSVTVPAGSHSKVPASLQKEEKYPHVQADGSQPTSRWAFNPATLHNHNLAALNLLISERLKADEDPISFETKKEAIAWLSQDYKA